MARVFLSLGLFLFALGFSVSGMSFLAGACWSLGLYSALFLIKEPNDAN